MSYDEVLGTMPEATLAVRRAAFSLLLSGQPVGLDEVAVSAGLSKEAAYKAAELVASVGMAEIEAGWIVGIDGLTTRPTRHRIVLNGVNLWTWCAYDILGIAAALNADAIGTTQCGLCEREIEVVVHEGKPEASTAAGWLPDSTCSNVLAEFCPNALLFCSSAHLHDWRAQDDATEGKELSVNALADHGRIAWRELVP